MRAIWRKIVIRTIYHQKHIKDGVNKQISEYQLAKGVNKLQVIVKNAVAGYIFLLIGIFSAGFGLKSFLLPNDFIDGGATGISLLIYEITGFSLSLLLVIVNIPFIILGYRSISRDFAIKTVISIIGLALVVQFFPYPEITNDKLLVSVFGGFFLGAGIGMTVRGGGVLDGTEVLAINISRRIGLSIGDIILIINVIIFLVAAYFLSPEIALYSMLTYISASKTVDFIIEGIEEYTGVTIISHKSELIRKMITEDLGRGVTVYKGEKGFGKRGYDDSEIDIIFTVVTRLEVFKLNAEIEKIDQSAFVVMNSIKDTKGGMIKKKGA